MTQSGGVHLRTVVATVAVAALPHEGWVVEVAEFVSAG